MHTINLSSINIYMEWIKSEDELIVCSHTHSHLISLLIPP